MVIPRQTWAHGLLPFSVLLRCRNKQAGVILAAVNALEHNNVSGPRDVGRKRAVSDGLNQKAMFVGCPFRSFYQGYGEEKGHQRQEQTLTHNDLTWQARSNQRVQQFQKCSLDCTLRQQLYCL